MKKTYDRHYYPLSLTHRAVEEMEREFDSVECFEIKTTLYIGKNENESMSKSTISVDHEFIKLSDDDKIDLLYSLLENVREMFIDYVDKDVEWL